MIQVSCDAFSGVEVQVPRVGTKAKAAPKRVMVPDQQLQKAGRLGASVYEHGKAATQKD